MNDTAVRRVWILPGFTAILVTVLLLWLAGTVADLLLLLFLGILIAVYLSAVTDVLAARTGLPRSTAFAVSIVLSVGALVGIGFLLVPPVVEQTRQLVTVLPEIVGKWEAGLERFLATIPGMEVGAARAILCSPRILPGLQLRVADMHQAAKPRGHKSGTPPTPRIFLLPTEQVPPSQVQRPRKLVVADYEVSPIACTSWIYEWGITDEDAGGRCGHPARVAGAPKLYVKVRIRSVEQQSYSNYVAVELLLGRRGVDRVPVVRA